MVLCETRTDPFAKQISLMKAILAHSGSIGNSAYLSVGTHYDGWYNSCAISKFTDSTKTCTLIFFLAV